MTDRELLELAAKAAGLKVTNYDWQMGCRVIDGGVYKDWNPLTDDGDALRLAVKLGYPHMIGTWMGCYLEKGEYEQNPYAATRRAIVRAAAEIGKESSWEYRIAPEPKKVKLEAWLLSGGCLVWWDARKVTARSTDCIRVPSEDKEILL